MQEYFCNACTSLKLVATEDDYFRRPSPYQWCNGWLSCSKQLRFLILSSILSHAQCDLRAFSYLHAFLTSGLHLVQGLLLFPDMDPHTTTCVCLQAPLSTSPSSVYYRVECVQALSH